MTDYIIYLVILLLFISNVAQYILYLKLKKKIKTRPESLELTEFIHDLTQGSALIKCTRVDSSALFLRSPRG